MRRKEYTTPEEIIYSNENGKDFFAEFGKSKKKKCCKKYKKKGGKCCKSCPLNLA